MHIVDHQNHRFLPRRFAHKIEHPRAGNGVLPFRQIVNDGFAAHSFLVKAGFHDLHGFKRCCQRLRRHPEFPQQRDRRRGIVQIGDVVADKMVRFLARWGVHGDQTRIAIHRGHIVIHRRRAKIAMAAMRPPDMIVPHKIVHHRMIAQRARRHIVDDIIGDRHLVRLRFDAEIHPLVVRRQPPADQIVAVEDHLGLRRNIGVEHLADKFRMRVALGGIAEQVGAHQIGRVRYG